MLYTEAPIHILITPIYFTMFYNAFYTKYKAFYMNLLRDNFFLCGLDMSHCRLSLPLRLSAHDLCLLLRSKHRLRSLQVDWYRWHPMRRVHFLLSPRGVSHWS